MRSLLFVPADSPKKLDKGMTSGADALIVDFEDSVAPDRKAQARDIARAFLAGAGAQAERPQLWVRINALDTGLADDDLAAVVAAKPDGILLPKAEGAASVVHLDAKLTAREALDGLADGAVKIIALVTETASALFNCGNYRDASPRLSGITWGAEDLSVTLGAETNRDGNGDFTDPYRLARVLSLAAAASAGVLAIDTVYVDFRNERGLRREAEEARREGFAAKLAIHPAQVPVINEVFTPSPAAIAKAETIVAAFAAQPGLGTLAIEGVMFDRPHLERARRLLARAGRAPQ
jgi:citrate lyase subunit beta/citryl-CoA lyase